MKAIIQRVKKASVTITEPIYYQEIAEGLLILLGIKQGDTEKDVIFCADKCCNLRIFSDPEDKMNLSVKDVGGAILIISQFTIYGETAKGNRPSFSLAARPEEAVPLYEKFIKRVQENLGAYKVKSGIFGAMMDIELINDGPVTVIVQSETASNSKQ